MHVTENKTKAKTNVTEKPLNRTRFGLNGDSLYWIWNLISKVKAIACFSKKGPHEMRGICLDPVHNGYDLGVTLPLGLWKCNEKRGFCGKVKVQAIREWTCWATTRAQSHLLWRTWHWFANYLESRGKDIMIIPLYPAGLHPHVLIVFSAPHSFMQPSDVYVLNVFNVLVLQLVWNGFSKFLNWKDQKMAWSCFFMALRIAKT